MKTDKCNALCEPNHGVHYLGRLDPTADLRNKATNINEFFIEENGRICKCGARAMPHYGMAYQCPLSNSGQHIR